jgi:hypothetical protein
MLRRLVLPGLLFIWLAFSLSAQDRGLTIIARQVTGQPDFEIGRQLAVIIGIDRYKEWPALRSAVDEARKVKEVLARRYFMDEFIEVYDEAATARALRQLFSQDLPQKLGIHDSLLVFFAGHGYLDSSNTGFWIAQDGVKDVLDQSGWLPNAQLRNSIGQLKAQRILILADACFSGDFMNVTRGVAPTINSAYFRKALQLSARQVLTSGSSETVPDESEFGSQLLNLLERNTEALLDPYSMYDRVRLGVTKSQPLLGTLPGNEQGGSFVLFLKQSQAAPSAQDTGMITPATPAQDTGTSAPTAAVQETGNSPPSTMVKTPVFKPFPGTYAAVAGIDFVVRLSCSTKGAVIYYTIDGSPPTTGSRKPAPAGILLKGGTTLLKAIAVAPGLADSRAASATYVLAPPTGFTTAGKIVYGLSPISTCTDVDPILSFQMISGSERRDVTDASFYYNPLAGDYVLSGLPSTGDTYHIWLYFRNATPRPTFPGNYWVDTAIIPSTIARPLANPLKAYVVMHLTAPIDNSTILGKVSDMQSYTSPVTVAWNAVPGAASYIYEVTRATSTSLGAGDRVIPTRSTKATSMALSLESSEPGSFYRLFLKAMDSAGNMIGQFMETHSDGYSWTHSFLIE